jgi:heme/copper-type cytochrome/quinol oxidase subunit 4
VGFWRRVDLQADASVWEKYTVFIFSVFLRNAGVYLLVYAAPKTQKNIIIILTAVKTSNFM